MPLAISSERAGTVPSVHLVFFFAVPECSIPNSPPFLVVPLVGFAEEDEVNKADEVAEGVGQLSLTVRKT